MTDADKAAILSAVDDALGPIARMAAAPSPMNTSQLATVAAAVRQAISVVVYGPPPAVTAQEVEAAAGEDPAVAEDVGLAGGAEAVAEDIAGEDAQAPDAPESKK